LKSIPKEKTEVRVQLKPAAGAVLGSFLVSLTGSAKFQNRTWTVMAAPFELRLVLPIEVKVETPGLTLAPGAKCKLKVSVARKGGYSGPVGLTVANLPGGVTASKATIPANLTSTEIELTAAAKAAPVEKSQVNVTGTAAEAGNPGAASASFSLRVVKK
jgi:hypothetical protein